VDLGDAMQTGGSRSAEPAEPARARLFASTAGGRVTPLGERRERDIVNP
jgi:hypothetical protein